MSNEKPEIGDWVVHTNTGRAGHVINTKTMLNSVLEVQVHVTHPKGEDEKTWWNSSRIKVDPSKPKFNKKLFDEQMKAGVVSVSQVFRYDHLNHEIPLGALVAVHMDINKDNPATGTEVHLKGVCMLLVVDHNRDCDGTPLYTLSNIPVKIPEGSAFSKERMLYHTLADVVETGYPQESLEDTGRRVTLVDSLVEFLGL